MKNLPSMGLIAWDNIEDKYIREQLAGNFAKIDNHDHTSGRGAKLKTGSYENESVTGPIIAKETVTTDKLSPATQNQLLVPTTPEARVERPVEASQTIAAPSATKPSFVKVQIQADATLGHKFEGDVEIGSKPAAHWFFEGSGGGYPLVELAIMVPANTTYTINSSVGATSKPGKIYTITQIL